MTIDVLFFAQIKEAMGCDQRSVQVADGTTVDGLVAAISSWPEWNTVSELPLTYAVNERVVDGGHELEDGDTVALLTPISGG